MKQNCIKAEERAILALPGSVVLRAWPAGNCSLSRSNDESDQQWCLFWEQELWAGFLQGLLNICLVSHAASHLLPFSRKDLATKTANSIV